MSKRLPSQHVPHLANKSEGTESKHAVFNKVILLGRLGQNALAKTAQNNREYAVLNLATQESWKKDEGDYETRTEWHRVYARDAFSVCPNAPGGAARHTGRHLRYCEVESGSRDKHRIAAIQANTHKWLSRVEAADLAMAT